jgi:hypothetical protein
MCKDVYIRSIHNTETGKATQREEAVKKITEIFATFALFKHSNIFFDKN